MAFVCSFTEGPLRQNYTPDGTTVSLWLIIADFSYPL